MVRHGPSQRSSVEELRRIVARLRKECPWDRKQTVSSMRAGVIEEAYELAEAIRERDNAKIREEIGDHLFVALFLAQVMEDTDKATLAEIVEGISNKLIRRHPHVFGSARVKDADEVLHNWHRIKEKEKGESILSAVPKALPALQRAESIQRRAKRVGFDWQDPRDVLRKVNEEVDELRVELRCLDRKRNPNRVREELGDLLFAIVNTARHMRIDAEDALQRATNKFTKRFKKLEQEFARRGKRLDECTLEEMDAVWERQKASHRTRSSYQIADCRYQVSKRRQSS